MDFGFCSPHRETGGTMHLPSPTHHGYRMEGSHFPSITQLRQSLSRSPSRPSRFLRAGKTDSQGSPISPLALSRAFNKPASPVASYSESPFGQQAPQATKKKFALRRSAPFRSSPRNRASTSKSPRRALVDSTDLGNSTPFVGRPIFGEENTHARKNSVDFWEQPDSKRFDIDDKPIKFEFSRSHPPMSSAPGANCFAATQPSPLKRRDGIMGFESVSSDTPNPKRRSLHGSLPSGDDFNIFEQTPAPQPPTEDFQRPRDGEPGNMFSTPIQNTQSPLRKTSALRRTVSQRNSTNSPRPKASRDGVFALPGPAASKTRQRYSLDGSSLSSAETEASFARPMAATQSHLRGGSGGYQRHPLSNAVTASTSSSNPGGETQPFAPVPPTPVPKKHPLSKSLPIGRSQRPQPPLSGQYATPYALKMVQLDSIPVPRSTGVLKSKRNRDIDSPGAERYIPPLTPCKNDSKRHSFPPADSPSTNKRGLQQPQFTPIAHTSKAPTESAGNRPSIFGSFGSISIRRGSFLSEVGDDENSHSPTGNHMTDSQSSADDMPPTPTKPNDGAGRRSKESSLRRKTFRQRPSLSNNTFVAPENGGIDIPAASNSQNATTPGASPHTPNESFAPPDPSRLSISGPRRPSLPFHPSSSFPPNTPTTPRDQPPSSIFGQVAIPFEITQNDVDESLCKRFSDVKKLGREQQGHFSQVFRVGGPVRRSSSHASPPGSQFWVVKKSQKPISGPMDYEKRLREVKALQDLRGNEHVVSFEDFWVESNHLYIQTEYCEGGDLKTFLLAAGDKSRLDDFRIWKILLELSSGLKFIHARGYMHLDLKPDNVLIDFEGVLKIADFGMACEWTAPRQSGEEGDRRYLAQEALDGRFDTSTDVFALGCMLAEIASNCYLPDYGESWQKLRSGQFADVLPSLTWSAESGTLSRDDNGDPIDPLSESEGSDGSMFVKDPESGQGTAICVKTAFDPKIELAKAPTFMINDQDPCAMDQVVRAMMDPEPSLRPTAADVYACHGCQWVDRRRRAGATIYEGNFGPSDEVLGHDQDPDIAVGDAMDIS